jgi:hypothetical protein
VLIDQLIGPEAIALDTANVYYTTNNPPNGPSTVGYISKDLSKTGVVVSNLAGAPAIVAAGSGTGAIAVGWSANSSGQPGGAIYSVIGGTATIPATVSMTMLGVAADSTTVFFTTPSWPAWAFTLGGAPPAPFSTSTEMAAGPIAADPQGVYWFTTAGHLLRANSDGTAVITLCMPPDTVNNIATDMNSAYWTDQSGGVYLVGKSAAGNAVTLNAPSTTPAYGIAVSPGNASVFFAQGSKVLRLDFPYKNPPVMLATGLVNPRGVAFDGTYLYVADKGTGNMTSPDGRILRIAP